MTNSAADPVSPCVSEQVTALPAPHLRPFVASYVGYRMEGFPAGVHAGLPSRHLTFVVSVDEPVDLVAMPDRAQRPDRFGALVGGLHVAPAMIRHDGNQHGVQLKITPAGSRALFGMPAAALASTIVTLGDVLGASAAEELRDRLHAARSWDCRFAILDDVLSRAVREARAARPEVVRAWDCIAATGGRVDIGSVARDVGWSRRHLADQFGAEFGHPPKSIARVMRFERSRLRVMRPGAVLARVAAECGYADQAHMARDWRDLAGASPSAWLAAERLPFVQGADGDAGAS
ncbi:MAG TPA: helix-turn-helix domain-containing protein [Acidimicrobiia bacterium]|nr:helix-turn-helix domain-containing protein [Acidimicrobiia bacterium]